MHARRSTILLVAVILCSTTILSATSARADGPYPKGAATPEIAAFLGADGFGSPHAGVAAEAAGFGRLVGLWDAALEIRAQDGSWVEGAPALWAWQYVLDGFATQDLVVPFCGAPAELPGVPRSRLPVDRAPLVRAGLGQVACRLGGQRRRQCAGNGLRHARGYDRG